MSIYEKPQSNEWVQPVMDGYKMACCDCGLVHDMDFQVLGPEFAPHKREIIEDDYRVEFRVRRNNRASAAIRRHRRKHIEQEGPDNFCDVGLVMFHRAKERMKKEQDGDS